MRVLCLTTYFPEHYQDQNGNYILDSVQALIEAGHELSVLVTPPWRPGIAKYIHIDFTKKKVDASQFSNAFELQQQCYFSLPRCYLRRFSNWSYIKTITPALENILRLSPFDLIQVHGELGVLAAVDVGKRFGIPVVATMHGIEKNPRFWPASQVLMKRALDAADRVVLVGEPLRPFFSELVGRSDHFRIVPNGFRIPPDRVAIQHGVWRSPLKIVSVCSLHEGKGIDLNLQALAKLKNEGFVDWTYTVVGRGRENENLQQLARVLGLESHVNFVGACIHEKVYHYLQQADIFLLPSYREAFGIAYLEAMVSGLLTIGVKGQGPQTFIDHEKTGLLVPPKDVDALVEMLKTVFTEQDRMQKIARAGQEFVRDHFTWQHHARCLTRVYHELVKE